MLETYTKLSEELTSGFTTTDFYITTINLLKKRCI